MRTALLRSLKNYAELAGNKRAGIITGDDVMTTSGALLSVFIREPEFQGQTKEKLATAEAARIVETAVRDHFDHWLTGHPAQADRLLDWIVERADERIRRRQEKEVGRKTAVRKLRLPGKLADCSATRRKAPSSSSSKAIPPAAPPSRAATARRRRSCPCAARS